MYNATVACVATDRCLPGQVHRRLEEIYTRKANSRWEREEEDEDDDEEEMEEEEGEEEEEGKTVTKILRLTFKKEIRREVFGKKGSDITWGMRNCARHIPPKSLTLAHMEVKVKEESEKVPYKIKEDTLLQALLAYKTNFEKQQKQRDRGEEVKPFKVGDYSAE